MWKISCTFSKFFYGRLHTYHVSYFTQHFKVFYEKECTMYKHYTLFAIFVKFWFSARKTIDASSKNHHLKRNYVKCKMWKRCSMKYARYILHTFHIFIFHGYFTAFYDKCVAGFKACYTLIIFPISHSVLRCFMKKNLKSVNTLLQT